MKGLIAKGLLTAALAVLVASSPARAQDNDGCTNATLKGDYAFTISGQIFLPVVGAVQRQGVALMHFDGAGHFDQVDFVLSSPNAPALPGPPPTDPVTGFHNQETGTYTVNQDCTGNYEIDDPPITTPNGQISGAIIKVMFVLSNHGHAVHAVVSALTPPGKTATVPALILAEGHKLGQVADDRD